MSSRLSNMIELPSNVIGVVEKVGLPPIAP
jgi:hypothetical protein